MLVSVKFQLKETNVSAVVILCLHLRKHMKTLQKYHLFHVSVDVFQTTECVMETAETLQTVPEIDISFMFPLLAEIIYALVNLFLLLLPETHNYHMHGR